MADDNEHASPRVLLDTYAAGKWWHAGVGESAAEEYAPKAFAALRALFDLADHYDDIGDRMWTESAADDIRRAITTALEADRG